MLSRQERQAKLLREAEEARLSMLEKSGRRETEQRTQRAGEAGADQSAAHYHYIIMFT
jgi:hypothetical protein